MVIFAVAAFLLLAVSSNTCDPSRHVALSAQLRAYAGADLLHVWAGDRYRAGIASVTFKAEWPGGSLVGDIGIDQERGWGTAAFVTTLPTIRSLRLWPTSVRWIDPSRAHCGLQADLSRSLRTSHS